MKDIIMPIKPYYVSLILSGDKKYELRKIKPKETVGKMYLYVTRPVMKIVGMADIKNILENDLNVIWEIVKHNIGISEKEFYHYFNGKSKAIAYELENIITFEIPKQLSEFGIKTTPQTFVYV